jgi:hypothetical protein
VILRIVRGTVAPDRLAGLAEGFVARFGPVARVTPGLVRYHLGIRPHGPDHDLVAITFWASVEAAVAAYEGDLGVARTLAPLSDDARLTEVAYFEVDESHLRRTATDPAILRITVGRVAEGIDASIQAELRARMHELPDAMTEAYVGRRIVGADVEIAFVSAWERVPTDRPLDAPIWPDISARYDSFLVETYVPILSGSPPATS